MKTKLLACLSVLVGCSLLNANPNQNPPAADPPPVAAPQPDDSQSIFAPPVKLADLKYDKIDESSGLAASRSQPGIFFTHNDSGDKPKLYAFNLKGHLAGIFDITVAKSKDWESMSSLRIDGKPHLLIADVGDNDHKRNNVELYLIEEPKVPEKLLMGTIRVRKVWQTYFTYEDGKHNCEAVAVDNERGEVLLISKVYGFNCAVYTLPTSILNSPESAKLENKNRKDSQKHVHIAKRIANIQATVVTAADISEDGRKLIIGTYVGGYLYTRNKDESWADALKRPPVTFPLPLRKQGETIAWDVPAKAIYLTSEKKPTPLWEMKLRDTK